MHFCSVCNMNKIGRVVVIYIILVAATGAVDLKSKSTSTSKTDQASKPKESATAAKSSQPHHVSAHASVSNGMGVASIAGVDTRYGRLSSMSGVKFYPPIDSSMIKTDNKGNFIFKSTDGKMPMPITITKEGDGVSGTIKIMPGSVSVSSSANSGSASASVGPKVPNIDPWSFMKPMMMNDLFFPDPFPAFPSIGGSAYHTRISEPSYHRVPEPTFPRISQPSYSRVHQPSYSSVHQPYSSRTPDPWKDMFKHTLSHHDIMTPMWYYPNFSPYFNYW
ncbi:hypothetical protein HF086_013177 [Spodoptera exigua]|uniref:Uncharacterized protein n=1 Tax=Spodoptera exigua TaxID=7107 RepID=A0A922SDB0_SPOEX|nr:hypothetical protein HF086_013177 [Spodoptera exigua]